MSGTLFLSEPSAYEGGELVVDSSAGRQAVKLPAGDLYLYPSARVHFVAPVTRGTRLGIVFWIRKVSSVIRNVARCSSKMSQIIFALEQQHGSTAEITRMTGCYHRLVQMWAQP